jgi:hypothetical protein
MENKRRAERISVDRLPESLKKIKIERLLGNDVDAETFNAGTIGIGLSVPLTMAELMANNDLFLKSIHNDFEIIGKIHYIKPDSADVCRVGLQFINTHSLVTYQKVLENVNP